MLHLIALRRAYDPQEFLPSTANMHDVLKTSHAKQESMNLIWLRKHVGIDLGSPDKSTTNQAHHRVAGGSHYFLVGMVDQD